MRGQATASLAALVWGAESHQSGMAGMVTHRAICAAKGAPAWRCGTNTGLPEAQEGVPDVVCAQVENKNAASCRVISVTGTQVALRPSCLYEQRLAIVSMQVAS